MNWIQVMQKSEELIGTFRSAQNKIKDIQTEMLESLSALRSINQAAQERSSEIEKKIVELQSEKAEIQKQIQINLERIDEFEKPLLAEE